MIPLESAQPGTVYLIGAGPGDPGLITVRGLSLLRTADVVVHDRFVPRPLLDEVRTAAEVIDLSPTPALWRRPQQEINGILINRAQRGFSVVRLKGGDPFVLGRGGEELAACTAAGLPVVVVPGISSATGAPAAAGIPLTHRGTARSFAVLTAVSDPHFGPYEIPYSALARMDTVVILMGFRRLPGITAGLVAAGLNAETPAACIKDAWTPAQRVILGTVGTIAELVRAAGLTPPVVTVIGQVVNRHAHAR